MNELFRRLHYLWNRRRYDRELAGDMEFHRDMAAREGTSGPGNTLRLREEAREAWGWMWLDRLSQDLRYAARMLQKSPGFTLAAILMLGLGIGVNVAVFGFFNLVFLRPLPVRDPGTLLRFLRESPGNFADNLPYAEVEFFSRHSRTLSAVLALNIAKLTMEGEEKQLGASFVTANFFSELGAPAALGRTLDPARDDGPGADPVVVLGYGFWQRRFGADPRIVGKTIRLNDKPATVVGVASPYFSGLGMGQPDVWAPIQQTPYFVHGAQVTGFSAGALSVEMWGRLQPGMTPKVVEDELRSLAAELRRQYPNDIWEKETLPSEPGGYLKSTGGGWNRMYPVFGTVGALCLLILFVACGNLGSLLLARGVARERELSIRVSVGAGRLRLLRQLFTESLLLAGLGAAAGLAFGYVVLRGLMQMAEMPVWLSAVPDGRVLAFAAGMGFVSAILFGLTPAWHSARRRHRGTFLRQSLIGAQVAASCVLLIVAGLLVRALHSAIYAPRGFDYQQVISIDPRLTGYTPEKAIAYFDALENRLRALPGVEAVSIVSNPPLGNRWTVVKTTIDGRAADIHYNNIDPSFFETMRIPLLLGRTLARGDAQAAVISESLAHLRWPSENPLGKQLEMGSDKATVVGVVGSARLVSPEDSDAVEVYRLADAAVMPSMVALVRTSGDAGRMVPMATSVARSLDPKLFPEVQPMRTAFQGRLKIAEYSALSVSLLGCVALFLACAGLVGLVAYAVSQRTREIGIRVALGAKPGQILSVVLRQFSLPVAAGAILGTGAAAALSQILRQMLYGVNNLDPIAYAAAVAVFAATAALAALVPARRALRVDPMRALRYE